MVSQQQLVAELQERGYHVTERQLRDWRAKGLLPRLHRRSQGRGLGILRYWEDNEVILSQAMAVCDLLQRNGRTKWVPLGLWFARECDPRNLARDGLLTAAQAQSSLAAIISGMFDAADFKYRADAPKDERWYWLAPMLLDAERVPSYANAWWERTLARNWSETAADDDGWISHVKQAVQTIHDVHNSESVLGSLPADLFEVLALAASAGPATAALRAFERIGGHDDVALPTVADAAAVVGRASLTLFNHADLELEAFTRKKEIQLLVRSDLHRVRRRHDQVSALPEQPNAGTKTHSFGAIATAANDAKAVTVHCVAERFGGGFVNFIGFVRPRNCPSHVFEEVP